MSADDQVYVYAATYPDREAAQFDYDIVKELYAADVIATYDAAIVSKDSHGHVHVHKREKAAEHGVVGGAAIGALLSVVLPGGVIAGAVVGGTVGGLAGHFARGMSRKDMHDLGETLERGEAALVVLAKSRLDEYVDKMFEHAEKQIEKEIKVDRGEFEQALVEEIEAEKLAAR